MTPISKQLKKLFKDTERAKKVCAKKYPDWEDDCFNALDNKFIWGICHGEKQLEPSFCTWNDAQVYFNRSTKRYYLDIDTGIYDTTQMGDLAWVELERLYEIKEGFRNFLVENNLRTEPEIRCFFSPDYQIALDANSLSELYANFCMMLAGYDWYRNHLDKME